MAAQQAQGVIDAEHEQDARRQHPQGLDGEVGHDAVVHVHDEQRHRQRQDINKPRRHEDVAVNRHLLQESAPEPVAMDDFADLRRALVEAEVRPGEDDDAGVARLDGLALEADAALARIREQHAGSSAVLLPAHQQAGFVAFQQQDGGQQHCLDLLQRAAHHLAGKTGARSGAMEEGRRQPHLRQGQAGRQRGARAGAAMDARQFDQTVEQRIMVQLVLGQALAQMQGCLGGCLFFVLFFAHGCRVVCVLGDDNLLHGRYCEICNDYQYLNDSQRGCFSAWRSADLGSSCRSARRAARS